MEIKSLKNITVLIDDSLCVGTEQIPQILRQMSAIKMSKGEHNGLFKNVVKAERTANEGH